MREYFLVYLIYGFAIINMGIFCLKEKVDSMTSLSLLKSLKYLGWFGIVHGLTEWITMVVITNIYPERYQSLYNIGQILKALSFAILMYFGFNLVNIKDSYKKVIKYIPIILFTLYLFGFFILISNYGQDYHRLNPKYNIIAMRYVLALASGIISAIALYSNSKMVKKQQSIKISKWYKELALVILLNSILEGLLVQSQPFFPANIINREVFFKIFTIEALFIKAIIGLLINYLLVKIINTFSWEQEEKLKVLETHKIVSEERRRLSLEIHDSIIQMLYAVGLKVEYLILNRDEKTISNSLKTIKVDLNNTIDKTRELMTTTALDAVEIDDLREKIESLVKKYSSCQDIRISLKFEISSIFKKNLTKEQSTQIYYIIQEAISNVIKHSKATDAEILVKADYEILNITIVDNGVGINDYDFKKDNHLGIESMKDRCGRIGGIFSIKNLIKGVKVKVEIPWEVAND